MELFVIIATKGRPETLHGVLQSITRQSVAPRRVFVVGTELADFGENAASSGITFSISDQTGLCAQRNRGIEEFRRWRVESQTTTPYAVVFFDDDFRPASTWLAECRAALLSEPGVVGITGRILADGVHGLGISEEVAREYLEGRRAPERHWAGSSNRKLIDCLYGCNMAFRDVVIESQHFDVNLPLYGWQEDRDYSARAARLGPLLYLPECVGVHLGVKSGRVSGVRFGYSQIANPWYLSRKGTMTVRTSLRFVSRHLLSNTFRSVSRQHPIDYAGRLRGNAVAILDVLRGRSHPMRAVDVR